MKRSIPVLTILVLAAACSSSPKREPIADAARHDGSPPAATPDKSSGPNAAAVSELGTKLFAPPAAIKAPLFCGYYASACEGGSSTSRMALITQTKSGLAIDIVGHDTSATDKPPRRYGPGPSPGLFVSRDDPDDTIRAYSTCRASLKPADACTLVLVDPRVEEPVFRGHCSARGAREYFKPCGDAKARSGGQRNIKLKYGNKTYELPLVASGSEPRFEPTSASSSDLERMKKAIVGLKLSELPGWLKTGGWEEAFPPIGNRWARSGYSALAAAYPSGELVYFLVQGASRYENLTVRDLVFAPAGTVQAWDGRDCDQAGMLIGFQQGGSSGLTLAMTGLFADESRGKIELRSGLKANCR